ncbi:Lipoxygenase 6 [Hibiscus syriacus]|uniref:Lipoxygenase 6 n=1 Tax=Hibiscus syriacus TaxID=106335 RepID=A0A6A3BNE9_HIBSY|nr:Lipoxygenase 6 [Hibiscus syriacus]
MLALKPTPSIRSTFSGTALRRSPLLNGILAAVSFPRTTRSWPLVRAVISDDKTVESPKTSSLEQKDSDGSVFSGSSVKEVRAVVTIRKKMKENVTEKLENQWEMLMNGIGRGILIQLISEEIDPVTNSGKSVETFVRGWLPKPLEHVHILEYIADFTVSSDFGKPGAVLITNLHAKEFHLLEIVIHGFDDGPIFFPANTWIHSRNYNPESRIIFRNQAFLPSQTPSGLKDQRREDLLSIRGKPDKDQDLARPVLGGEERPYPRRCRTGRPPSKTDPLCESRIEKPHPVYVPRDEAFEEIKQDTFSAGRLKALLHNLVPSIAATLSSSDIPFTCFSDIDKLYIDGFVLKDDERRELGDNLFIGNTIKRVVSVGQKLLKYEIPAIIRSDRFSWLRDNEFARQALAGVNPVNIEIVKEFPILSKLDPAIYGPPESAITKELIEQELHGMSVDKAIEEKRLFILDFHDMLLPFIKR